MKQAVSFRLSNEAMSKLLLLEKALHISKTAIVENALQFYAAKKLPTKNPSLVYAGILSAHEASTILQAVKANKKNKAIKTKL